MSGPFQPQFYQADCQFLGVILNTGSEIRVAEVSWKKFVELRKCGKEKDISDISKSPIIED